MEVNIDGKPITFSQDSKDDVWIISCMYTQSQHAFTIQIPFMQTLSPATNPWIAIIVVIALLVALAGIAVIIRRRRRTAKIVAAILKQNRPIN
jgi:flagellar biosynthesis/type III secretory pathway M-ring protein FliF/YscJ